MASCLAIAGAALPLGATGAPIIQRIEISKLIPALRMADTYSVRCDEIGVHYCYRSLQAEGTHDLAIGVLPSASAARGIYASHVRAQLRTEGSSLGGLANQAAWLTSGEGEASLLFRRVNVLVQVAWEGEREKAIVFAQKIDDMLLHRTDLCPRGEGLDHPAVELISPAVVAEDAKLTVKYRGLKAMLLRTEARPELHASGTVEVEAKEAGTRTVELRFYSGKCAVFWVPLLIGVVPAGCLPTAETTRPWEWPGETLYFVENRDVGWDSVPAESREMIALAQPHLAAPRGAEDWRQKALNDLAATVQPQWLPLPDMVRVYENRARPNGGVVYNARLTTRGCSILYMGTIGRRVFAYVEQPNSLSEAQVLLKRQDLLRPDVAEKITDAAGEEVFPRVSCLTRDLQRFRAFEPSGPYEPVSILLLRAEFPGELNLEFPGYR